MQVILQERIKKLGDIGDLVTVASGYARNYLIREGKALRASKENIAVVESRRTELVKLDKQRLEKAKVRAKSIESIGSIEVSVMCNAEGRLFGAVQTAHVLDQIKERGQTIDKSEIRIVGAPIRKLGTYEIVIDCHADVAAVVPLHVVSSEPIETDDTLSKTDETDSTSEPVDDGVSES